jgi:hypothetical protein
MGSESQVHRAFSNTMIINAVRRQRIYPALDDPEIITS